MFTVLFLFFPAGLVLYWLINNLLSLAQQTYVYRQVDREQLQRSQSRRESGDCHRLGSDMRDRDSARRRRIGVIRLSGPSARRVAQSLISVEMRPRRAHYCQFIAEDEVLDNGLVLWFPAPHSFTGEDVVELQGHGGPVVQNEIIQVLCHNGARLARQANLASGLF